MRLPTTILAAMTLTGCVADAEAKAVKAPASPELTEVTAEEQAAAEQTLKQRVKQVLIDVKGEPEHVDPCPPCGMG